MTVGAVLEVELPRRFGGLVLGEARRPGHLVRVYVEKPRLRVERGTAPLRAAVKAGKEDRLLPDPEGRKRLTSIKRPKTLYRPAVCLWGACGQHLFRQHLPGKWGGFCGQRLGLGRHLAGHVAGRILQIFDGEERLSALAVKDVHMPGLGGL